MPFQKNVISICEFFLFGQKMSANPLPLLSAAVVCMQMWIFRHRPPPPPALLLGCGCGTSSRKRSSEKKEKILSSLNGKLFGALLEETGPFLLYNSKFLFVSLVERAVLMCSLLMYCTTNFPDGNNNLPKRPSFMIIILKVFLFRPRKAVLLSHV